MSGTCRYTATGDLECIYSKTPQVTPDNQVTFKSPLITETKTIKLPEGNFNEMRDKTVALVRKLQNDKGIKLFEGFENAPPKCTNMCNGADAACISYNLNQGNCTR